MEIVDFTETIAACDLKIGRYRNVNELMEICDYSRSRSFLDLGQRSITYENLIYICLSQKPLSHLQPKFECKL